MHINRISLIRFLFTTQEVHMKYNNVKKTIIHLLSIIMAISAVVASSLLVSATKRRYD